MMRRVTAATAALLFGLLSACAGGEPPAADAASIEHACAGLPDALVARTVADLRASVEGVEPLRDGSTKLTPRLLGAVVQVRATPGMTAEWLERVLQCDAARQGPSASCTPEACPLAPAGASRNVTPTPTGFAIALRSRDLDVAHEIDRRARGFARPAQPSAAVTASTP
jgi:hypothetical protein